MDNETREIVRFIDAGGYDNPTENKECIERITVEIDEQFLMQRAEKVKTDYDNDDTVKSAINSLFPICNEIVKRCDLCPVNKYCNTFIKEKRQGVRNNDHKMIDLFCGSGGLSLGFTQEGFVTALANDIQDCCVDTYAHNHPETPRSRIVLGDIKEVVDNIEEILDGDRISVVIGGPPCQGFSNANRQRIIDDPRNVLYKQFVRVVQMTAPPFFVMENVKGMLGVADQVVEDFERIGYTVSYRVLNAKDYGVPQNRERLIYIGNNIGVENERVFEQIIQYGKGIPDYYLKDAIYGLRPLQASTVKNQTDMESEECGRWIESKRDNLTNDYIELINQGREYNIVCNHKARYNNDRDIEIFGRLDQGDRSDDPKIADIMPYKSRSGIFKDKYFKLEMDKVSKTITAHMKFDCNMYIHPTQARGLTPREAARIQSYPDDYFFRGSFTKTYMQIGNSVPPLLGRAIAQAILMFL